MEMLLPSVVPSPVSSEQLAALPVLPLPSHSPWTNDDSCDDIDCDEGSDLDDYAWIKWNDPLSPRLLGEATQLTQRESRLSLSIISLSASEQAELAQLTRDLDLEFGADRDDEVLSDYGDSLDAIDCEENSALDDYDWIKWTTAPVRPVENYHIENEKIDLIDIDIDDLSLEQTDGVSRSLSSVLSPETPISPAQSHSDVSSLFDAECTD